MLSKGFVVAMAADVALAKYDEPATIVRRTRRWVILSRWGSDGQHLTVSDAGPVMGVDAAPPLGLSPLTTALGLLLSEAKAASAAEFLLVRHCPPNLRIAGQFFPADGHCTVTGMATSLYLAMQGRHSHSRGTLEGRPVRKDIPDPPANAKYSMAWHITAVRRPWSGEFLAGAPPVSVTEGGLENAR